MGLSTEPEAHPGLAWGMRNCRAGGKGSSHTEHLGAGAACGHCSRRCVPMADVREGHRLITCQEGVVAGAWPGAWEGPCSCCSGAEGGWGGGEHCALSRRPGPGLVALLCVGSRR